MRILATVFGWPGRIIKNLLTSFARMLCGVSEVVLPFCSPMSWGLGDEWEGGRGVLEFVWRGILAVCVWATRMVDSSKTCLRAGNTSLYISGDTMEEKS